jgi:hypothetical protein
MHIMQLNLDIYRILWDIPKQNNLEYEYGIQQCELSLRDSKHALVPSKFSSDTTFH